MDADHAKSRRFETHINYKPELASEFPRLSHEVVDYLGLQGESPEEVVLLPAISAPSFDDSLPLTSYFVSTSHNTYLLGDQLWGKASPLSYQHVIAYGAHCVEIDVWPGHDEESGPIVTHGWTLAQHIPFQAVCVAIRDAVDAKEDDWPVFISLECHVDVAGQQQLVDILKGAWGEKLVVSSVEGVDSNNVAPRDLKGRIIMMIEYYPANIPKPLAITKEVDVPPDSDSESSSDSSSESHFEKKEKRAPRPKISEELAALGIYAHSMKPKKDWLKEELTHPLHILINISESAMSSLIPNSLRELIKNGQNNLRRVYPRGVRIESGNLDPLKFWRAGSHFAALNWQEFDAGTQLNEAMFAGTPGWVLKPAYLLGEDAKPGKVKFTLDIVGLSALPRPEGDRDFSIRARVHLLHANGDQEWKSDSVHCKDVPETGADAMFNEHCEWEFDSDELAFLRIIITKNKEFERDAHLAIFCARIAYIQQGWRFLRLLDDKGKDTHATLLVRFTIERIE